MNRADVLIHGTTDPEVIVAEYRNVGEALGTAKSFDIADIQILHVRDDLFARLWAASAADSIRVISRPGGNGLVSERVNPVASPDPPDPAMREEPMTSIRSKARGAVSAAVMAIAAGALVSMAPAASASTQAIPPDCSVWRSTGSWAVSSKCTQRAHRAAAECRTYTQPTYRWYFGAWANRNEVSTVNCPQDTTGLRRMSVDYPD
ncbi:hypothetical protein NQK81_34635 [Amycolatopsis roodepoortensis]|uniref:hypothetical protein n=1 Tax=Amycolatopsis roodepoortensis TaxID=700274 RepID=UPI00214C4CBD|nr:hypothetical protein [Amycolatopsis roodepoortensis]UUV29864.1 hypothetical protein NQK81_34635 [Amycolatopsis roodepoortensis]